MGPVSRMAVYATERALGDAGLIDDPVLKGGRTGIAYGSSFGSPKPVIAFAELMTSGASTKLTGTSYVQMMSHTAAVNIGIFFGVTGRIVTTSSACTSASQGIGYGFEAIRYGMQEVMIVGGAEELCASEAAVFDTLYATSVRNDAPSTTPRPFDRDRDGLVIGEGAATLVLEELEHARARGARIHAELVGFGTNSDGNHITQPSQATMEVALRMALADAGVPPEAIGFVNAHGTATDWGDVAESHATAAVLGHKIPIHALKSYFGHSLGACGSIEAWLGITMMNEGWFAPTVNLENLDEKCAELDYVTREPRRAEIEFLMSNNFAFGGINTSLIFRRV
jgi:3-oxoacyl-[acyl-carrier-protein] synthase II